MIATCMLRYSGYFWYLKIFHNDSQEDKWEARDFPSEPWPLGTIKDFKQNKGGGVEVGVTVKYIWGTLG